MQQRGDEPESEDDEGSRAEPWFSSLLRASLIQLIKAPMAAELSTATRSDYAIAESSSRLRESGEACEVRLQGWRS